MGLWNSVFGRAPTTAADVRRLLFEAVARGDQPALARLAAQHEAVVLEHFSVWKTVPEETRRDPAAMQAYAQGLIALAQHFATARGRPELFALLAAPAGGNPIVRWQGALQKAGTLMQGCDYAKASELLRTTLEETKGLTGTAADEYRPISLGQLGTCLFQQGRADAAVSPFERALALCEAGRDDDGVRAYLGNLYEVHRYRGDPLAAASCLERRAALCERRGQADLAARDRRQLSIVRAGEPLCRVVAEHQGAQCELGDLAAPARHVRFIFVRNRITLRPCTMATDRGTAHAEAGDLDAALDDFRIATDADRLDPWPPYHSGTTLLHLRRYHEAVEAFRHTEELAPGWYQCRADRWLAEQLAGGAISHGQFEQLRGLMDGAAPPEQALSEVRRALAAKEIGELRLIEGNALSKLERGAEAQEAWRRGLAIAEEQDVKTRLLTALGAHLAEPSERAHLLGEAIQLEGNLVAAAMATVILRAGPSA